MRIMFAFLAILFLPGCVLSIPGVSSGEYETVRTQDCENLGQPNETCGPMRIETRLKGSVIKLDQDLRPERDRRQYHPEWDRWGGYDNGPSMSIQGRTGWGGYWQGGEGRAGNYYYDPRSGTQKVR